MTPTRTGTVVAVRDGDAITIAMTVTPLEFIDMAAGLAYVDILGGFGAWRTVPPNELTPARIAGTFNLRRTYGEPTERHTTPHAPAAQEAPAGARENTADAPVPRQQAGCGGGGAERGEAEPVNVAYLAGADPVARVPESAGEGELDADCRCRDCRRALVAMRRRSNA